MKMYTVYDSKIQAYDKPFVLRNMAEATRAWSQAVNDPQTMMSKYPADYVLYEIAEWDDTTGKIKTYDAPKSVGIGTEFINVPKT